MKQKAQKTSFDLNMKEDAKQKVQSLGQKALKFFIGAGGIYMTYIVYGLIQEILYKTKFLNENTNVQERFNYPFAILLFQSIFSYVLASVMVKTQKQQTNVPKKAQMLQGIYNFVSMVASNSALQYISYPLQALFKSCKVLSVLIVGLCFGQFRYRISQYMSGILVTIGIAGFNLLQTNYQGSDSASSNLGIFLLVTSLFTDGMLADQQSITKQKYRCSSFDMMAYISKYCAILSLVWSIVQNQLIGFIQFCTQHFLALQYMVVISIFGCLGQIFIFYTISHFGPVVLALVTTTRKFFTVLLSIFLFNHTLISSQWICVIIVFAGVTIELYDGIKEKKAKKKEEDPSKAHKPAENPQASEKNSKQQ